MDMLAVEPLDVLHLRGNHLFEGAGAYGQALMPPWPSLAAGAVRSRMLADAGVDFRSFAGGAQVPNPKLHTALGTPKIPGAFRVVLFTLARRRGGAAGAIAYEPCLPLPSDVVVTAENLDNATYLEPCELPVITGAPLSKHPVPKAALVGKPVSGLWLTEVGWQKYLAGAPIPGTDLLRSSALWRLDPRLGIALDGTARTAASGMLYTAETVALSDGVGFLIGIEGANGLLPTSGLLRFGGDGRGATVRAASSAQPQPDWTLIGQEKKFRIVLTTPAVLPDGWKLPGIGSSGWWQDPSGKKIARWVSAAVPRAEVVSGWDLARQSPKTAHRVAPAGSVYWFEELQCGTKTLQTIAARGLWSCMASAHVDSGRRAEGFNNVQVAAWPR